MSMRNEKALVGDVLFRLAAIEGLIKLSHVSVRLRVGDSSKLSRADEDLDAALAGLAIVHRQLADLTSESARQLAEAKREVYSLAARNAMRSGKRES